MVDVQGSAPLTSLSETSSDADSDNELNDNDVINPLEVDRIFITGVLDELKVGFNYSYQVKC